MMFSQASNVSSLARRRREARSEMREEPNHATRSCAAKEAVDGDGPVDPAAEGTPEGQGAKRDGTLRRVAESGTPADLRTSLSNWEIAKLRSVLDNRLDLFAPCSNVTEEPEVAKTEGPES